MVAVDLPFDVAAPIAAAHPDRDIEIGLGFPIHSLNISFGKPPTFPANHPKRDGFIACRLKFAFR